MIFGFRIVDYYVSVAKREAWSTFSLKRVEVAFCCPVVPVLYFGLQSQFRVLFRYLAFHYLLEVWQCHLKVGAESGKLATAPYHEAAILRLHDVGRCLECEVEIALGVLHGEVFEQRHGAAFGNQAFGADAKAWGTEHQNLVFGYFGITNNECANEVHCGIFRGELHLGDLHIHRRRIVFLGNLQREADRTTGQEVFSLCQTLGYLGVIFANVKAFSQTLDAFVSLALKLFGVWDVGIADKVVDTPIGE